MNEPVATPEPRPDATPEPTREPTAFDTTEPSGAAAGRPALDLEAIERDLAGVERALVRLDDGTYWTDEVTGELLPDELLAADPVARRVG